MAKLKKIGVQLFTVRDYMKDEEQLKTTFEKLKKLGFDEAQTAGCTVPFDKFGEIAKNAGIDIIGTHEDFNMMVGDPEKAMMLHDDLGAKIMGIGGFFSEGMQGYIDFVEKANKLCEVIGPKGFKFTYHNHSHEFRHYNGQIPFEYLADNLNKDYGSFCLDTFWVQHGGADVRYWIERLAGRIDILHLKDFIIRDDGHCYFTQVGSGNLYWDGIIDAALKSGTKHFIVEQDSEWLDNDPFKSLEMSSKYLHERFM